MKTVWRVGQCPGTAAILALALSRANIRSVISNKRITKTNLKVEHKLDFQNSVIKTIKHTDKKSQQRYQMVWCFGNAEMDST